MYTEIVVVALVVLGFALLVKSRSKKSSGSTGGGSGGGDHSQNPVNPKLPEKDKLPY